MARRTKQLTRNRSTAHKKLVGGGRKRRIRARSRGMHPASARRRKRAARKSKKK